MGNISGNNTWTGNQTFNADVNGLGQGEHVKEDLGISAGANVTSIDTTYRAVGIYYLDRNGNHRLRFNIAIASTASSSTTHTYIIDGVTFKNVATYFQPCDYRENSGIAGDCNTVPNTGGIQINRASATSGANLGLSGDVELESKPTWAP